MTLNDKEIQELQGMIKKELGATLGTQIKKYVPNSFGIEADLVLDFDWSGNEVIELLDSEDNSIDVSNAKELPEEAKLTDAKSIDINIQMLVEDGQLKDVVKDEKGSPEAQIIYNVKLSKEEGWCGFVWSRGLKNVVRS